MSRASEAHIYFCRAEHIARQQGDDAAALMAAGLRELTQAVIHLEQEIAKMKHDIREVKRY